MPNRTEYGAARADAAAERNVRERVEAATIEVRGNEQIRPLTPRP